MYPAISSAASASAPSAIRPAAIPFWLWPNILSLDAPLVALVWQDFIARCYPPATPSPAARFALFLAVWAIYIADRLLDVRTPAPRREAPRHRFYRQNPAFAKSLLALLLAAALLTALLGLPSSVWTRGASMAALVVAYMAVFPLLPKRALGNLFHCKQPSAAFLFSAGVFLVSWSETPVPWRVLGAPALAFAALCFTNMKLIERRFLFSRGRILLPNALMAFGMVRTFVTHSPWYAAVAAAAAGLAAIESMGDALSRDARGVLADLVLLTPLLLRL